MRGHAASDRAARAAAVDPTCEGEFAGARMSNVERLDTRTIARQDPLTCPDIRHAEGEHAAQRLPQAHSSEPRSLKDDFGVGCVRLIAHSHPPALVAGRGNRQDLAVEDDG